MVGVIVTIVVPPAKYGKYMAIISSVFAVASVLGPVLGGAINERSSWRWVFLLKYASITFFFKLLWAGICLQKPARQLEQQRYYSSLSSSPSPPQVLRPPS